jgi:hypothetical protein
MDTATAERVWTRWLKDYWKLRWHGTPKPLLGREANHTACWALSVGYDFPEAVKIVASMADVISFENDPLLYRIDRKGLAKTYPEATADLLLYYLRSLQKYFHPDEHVKNVWQALRAGGVPKTKLQLIREQMFRLSYDLDAP